MNRELIGSPREVHDELLQIVHFSKKSIVVLGKLLSGLKRDDMFKKAVGNGADTWEDYLKQPEIGLSTAEAAKMIQVYEEFIVRLGYDEDTVSDIPNKNMTYLLPLIKKISSQEEADELIADATLLSQKDFKLKLFEVKMGERATKHLEYFIMAKTMETNTLERVHDISSDLIKQTFNLP